MLCERRASGSHKISRNGISDIFPAFVRFPCVLFGFIFPLQPRKPSHALEISTRIRDYAKNRLAQQRREVDKLLLLAPLWTRRAVLWRKSFFGFCMSRREKRPRL